VEQAIQDHLNEHAYGRIPSRANQRTAIADAWDTLLRPCRHMKLARDDCFQVKCIPALPDKVLHEFSEVVEDCVSETCFQSGHVGMEGSVDELIDGEHKAGTLPGQRSVLPPELPIIGQHRPSEGPVTELDSTQLSPTQFVQEFVNKRRPVVIRNGLKIQGTNLNHWMTNEYLHSQFGHLQLRIEEKTEGGATTPLGDEGIGRDSVANFLRTYQHSNKYAVSPMPSGMQHDLRMPNFLFPSETCSRLNANGCENATVDIMEYNFWMSSGATRSIIHRDAHHTLGCVVDGEKHWLVFDDD